MNFGGALLEQLSALIALLVPHCRERATLDELARVLAARSEWGAAHALFSRIRERRLAAGGEATDQERAQFDFEEICAKTIYNLSGESAPFDADAPYFVIPTALRLARHLGVPEVRVLELVR